MWLKKKKKLYLNISKINQNEFKIDEEDGLIFVRPKKNKWSWTKDEERLRSVIVDLDGLILSSSWPKFFNYGENLTDTEILNDALKNNKEIKFTSKMDGSLCIRSIINEKIILRTRGTLHGQFTLNNKRPTFYERFYEVAKEKYPRLLDPNFYPDYSLLFEYVSPTNRIVLTYDYTDLVFIGGVKHSDLTLLTWEEIKGIAKEGNLKLVELHTLPTDPKKLIQVVHREWIGQEGIVARCKNGQIMVKIKSEDYLAKHRTKATMNYVAAVIIIRNENIDTPEKMDKYCQDKDFDWELGQDMIGYLEDYKKAKAIADALMNKARNIIKDFELRILEDNIPEGRIRKKRFALFIKEEQKYIKSVCFSLYGKSEEKLESFINKLIENKGVGYEI